MSTIGKGGLTELKSVEEFNTLLKSFDSVLVDFSAVWCGPCRMLTPVLEDLARHNASLQFVKVDIDKLPSLASQFSVFSVPHVVLFKHGKPVDSFLGVKTKEAVQSFLDKHKY